MFEQEELHFFDSNELVKRSPSSELEEEIILPIKRRKLEINKDKPRKEHKQPSLKEISYSYNELNGITEESMMRLDEQQEFVPTSMIHPVFRSIFPYDCFNKVQTACLHVVYDDDMNCVVSAPTGSGKTVLLELAIVRLLQKYMGPNEFHYRAKGRHKCVYMAPIKALCQEKSHDWKGKFGKLGIICKFETNRS